MIYNGKEIAFPAINKLSFFKVIESLETLAKDKDPNISSYAKKVLKDVEPYPILKEGFEDLSLIKKYKKPIDQLLRNLFPDVLLSNEIKGVIPPFEFEPFFTSTRFGNILKDAGGEFDFSFKEFSEDRFFLVGCLTILGGYYHYPVDNSAPFIIDIPNKKTGITRSYRMAFNADLMEVERTKSAIDITEDDFRMLMDNFGNMTIWREKFPANSWILRGVGIVNLMDVTQDQSISMMTSNLLNKGQDTFQKIQQNVKTLFNIPDMEVTIAGFENGSFCQIQEKGQKSMMMGGKDTCTGKEALCDYSYHMLIEKHEPIAISDVDVFHEIAESYMTTMLKKQKIKSYIMAPIVYDGEILGFLELSSYRKHELNKGSITKLEEVIPILSMAANRFREDSKNRIEAIIQQECTTIHSSVKWKFEEVAKKYMIDQQEGKDAHFEDIVFKDVYPLYGQIDIKGSSTRRNEAVRTDLLTQMKAVRKVLKKAHSKLNLPIYEELMYRIDHFRKEIDHDLLAGSEHKILGFLRSEIYPVFDHLKKSDRDLREMVREYNAMLDENLKMVYQKRKAFDESVAMTNQGLANFLDRKQEEAQAMYPHYFERYKTDGVEYNMYIGNSITQDDSYDQVFLHNLRLWQLIVSCEMEREFSQIQKDLPAKLEVASLVLAYSTPLAVNFRMDEKRFDVDGAYNARYEIVKKRVDKAHIKGTDERITVPGKIAIIYSSDQDAAEYRRYLKFLMAKGYVKKGSLEKHDLEDLQGITGLKALRVEVELNGKLSKGEKLTLDEVMEAVNANAEAN